MKTPLISQMEPWNIPSAETSLTLPLDAISGIVKDENQPVVGAVVRVQNTTRETRTDQEGHFTLTELKPHDPVTLTAWAPGYYIVGSNQILPGKHDVELILVSHATDDNPAYMWISAFASAGNEANCQNCHAEPGNPDSSLPFDEWLRDAHSGSAQNPRFLTMYTGTNLQGSQSPSARFGDSRRFEGVQPLLPAPDLPYYGSGFKLDYPNIAGSCSACHVPAAHMTTTFGADPTTVTGVGAEGVTCDFCHKVWDVSLDPITGLPDPNLPGILSIEFLRPMEGHQFFAGPFDDVAPGEDTYVPLQQESQFCAPCHHGVFWDTVVYDSFGEWLESPYSDPETGQTCQDCHMPPGGTTHIVPPERGGLERDPDTIYSHQMPGAVDVEFLQNAVTVTATARKEGKGIFVQVDIANDNTGHHVPTDSPLRHLILLVQATSVDGDSLQQLCGPTVPTWGGVGDPEAGYYAGLPGTAYAKILQEFRSELYPTAAYWNPTRILSDNRIPALGNDTTNFTFAVPEEGDVDVTVTLLFRRAFIELADQKGWHDPDIVMNHQSIIVTDDIALGEQSGDTQSNRFACTSP